MTSDAAIWNARAAAAERAVVERFVRHVGPVAWGRSAWPRVRRSEGRAGWHYWWSAHLVDAAVDAARHRPSAVAARLPGDLLRGILVRNPGWGRPFYDDLAWFGLAARRAGWHRVADRVAGRLEAAIDPGVGALPWRVDSRLFNAPANGPAAILLARTGRVDAAARLAAWLHVTLDDAATGLVLDGVVDDADGRRPVCELYTYCQGVALGADLATGSRDQAAALVGAVARWAMPAGVLPGAGGGDGGLFAGIACRYLALAAVTLTGEAATTARDIVLASAEAAWHHAVVLDRHPLFPAEWRAPADPARDAAERDLSVQIGAWLALEAAVSVSDSECGRINTKKDKGQGAPDFRFS